MLNLMQTLKTHFREIDIAYLKKWLLVGALIGIVAGLGAIAFATAITWSTDLFLGLGAGFYPPQAAGEAAGAVAS